MKIVSIELNNIGLYKNQKINFPFDNKNTIIIWGNNGAGKTTLLNSIKIGLLGDLIFTCKYEEYCSFIKNELISSRCTDEIKKAHVIIEILLSINNSIEKFKIKREWTINKDILEEKVTILNNDNVLSFEEKEYIINRIKNLLPPSLMNTIIFDGEKAINVLNNDEMHKLIKNIVYSVFGMDVYDNLVKDISLYLKNEENGKMNSSTSQLLLIEAEGDYKKLLLEKKNLSILYENQLEFNKDNQNNLIQNLNKLEEKTGIKLDDLSCLEYNIDDMSAIKNKLDNKIKHINEEILPLKILHNKIKNLIQAADAEKPYLILNDFERIEEFFANDLEAKESIENLKKKIQLSSDIKLKYNFSNNQYKYIYELDKMLDNYNKDELIDNYKSKNILFDNIKNLLNSQKNLNDKFSKEIIKNIKKYSDLVLNSNNELVNIKNMIIKNEEDVSSAKDYYDRIKKSIKEENKLNNSYISGLEYKESLEDFININTTNILNELNKKILKRLNELHFRNNSINEVYISPRNYKMQLFEKSGNVIPSKLFSAGEKQILLGLIISETLKMSGLNNFFLFDTPVGRLDMNNRKIFTEEIILKVSDQSFIFATDSDYSLSDFKELKNNISCQYKLCRDSHDKIVLKTGSIYEEEM